MFRSVILAFSYSPLTRAFCIWYVGAWLILEGTGVSLSQFPTMKCADEKMLSARKSFQLSIFCVPTGTLSGMGGFSWTDDR